ncbi:MAG: hypothetical protein LLG20_27905 [Acidobacteriales bacterium]|nr:hypothetical protein [Terriglobales bacterium]
MIINTDTQNLLKPPADLDLTWRRKLADLLGIAFGNYFNRIWPLQLQLLEIVTEVEANVTSLRSRAKALRSRIPRLRSEGDMDAVRTIQHSADELFRQEEEQLYLRDCLLIIGDHIAARLLDPDTIRRFSNFQPAGFIHGKEGLESEIRAAESFLARGYMVLLNDLTHSLRVGDLTLRKGEEVRTFEVKSNPRAYQSKEATRQIEIPRSIHDYIKTDVLDRRHRISGVPDVMAGAVRVDSDVKEDWHWDIAGQIHKALRNTGVAHVVRGRKHYLVARRRAVGELSSTLDTLTANGNWVVSNIRRRVEAVAEVSPFTQWFRPESSVEIMAGDLIVLSAFGMADLESLFAAKSLRLVWKRKMTDLFPLRASSTVETDFKPDERFNSCDHQRLKLMYGFLAVESFVDIVAFLLSPEAAAQMKEKLSKYRLNAAEPSARLLDPETGSDAIQ